MAKYPWNECIADQTERYGSAETARKVCGSIRAKSLARKRSSNMSGCGCGCGGGCGCSEKSAPAIGMGGGCGCTDPSYIPGEGYYVTGVAADGGQRGPMGASRHVGRMSSATMRATGGGDGTGVGIAALLFPIAVIGGILLYVNTASED